MFSPVLLAVLGFLAFAAGGFYLMFADNKRRTEKLTADLTAIGFTWCDDKAIKDYVLEHLRIINQNQKNNRILVKLYRKAIAQKEYDLFFGDYYIQSASGKAKGSSIFFVCLISKEGKGIPEFDIIRIPKVLMKFAKFATPLMDTAYAHLKKIDLNWKLGDTANVYAGFGQEKLIAKKDDLAGILSRNPDLSITAKVDTLIVTDVQMAADRVSAKPVDISRISRLTSAVTELNNLFNES